MGKKKKPLSAQEVAYEKNIRQIQDFEVPQGEDQRYIRLSIYMMSNPNWIKLSSSAKEVFVSMKAWALRSEEYLFNLTFEYSTTLLYKIGAMSNNTCIRALKELQYYGFIEKVNNATTDGGFTQKWKFSAKWQEKTMPNFESRQ